MQPLNALSSLPKDLLIPCITGRLTLNESNFRIFIYSGVKYTCRDLCTKINQLIPKLFIDIYLTYQEIQNIPRQQLSQVCSLRFVCNWIKGTSKITRSKETENESTISDWPFMSLLQDKNHLSLICHQSVNTLKIHKIVIENGIILNRPMTITSGENIQLQRIVQVFSHLDKLFILGFFGSAEGYDWENALHYSLITIDITDQTVNSIYTLDSTIDYQSTNMSSPCLGKIKLTTKTAHHSHITHIDYT